MRRSIAARCMCANSETRSNCYSNPVCTSISRFVKLEITMHIKLRHRGVIGAGERRIDWHASVGLAQEEGVNNPVLIPSVKGAPENLSISRFA